MICHSGGAKGSDMFFERVSIEYKVQVKAYSFDDHTSTSRNKNILTDDEIAEGWKKAQKAAKYLKRNTSNLSQYIKNLLSRNWFQVKNSSAIFAVGYILNPGDKGERVVNKTNKQIVDGGTGYAVEMAIQHNKPVFIFDQDDNKWYKWNINQFREIDYVPKLTEKFAGIGTRQLNLNGMSAIRDLFDNTFKTKPL
jgi:hypothetical protein